MNKVRKEILKYLKMIPNLIPDVLAIIGAISISYGAYIILKPLGYIILGIMFIGSAVILSKSEN